MKFFINLIIIAFFLSGISSCKKYLDEKSDPKLSTPRSLDDLQLILDNVDVMKGSMIIPYVSSDEFYIKDVDYGSYTNLFQKNAYVWDPSSIEVISNSDWNYQYRVVFYANTVLDNLKNISLNSPTDIVRANSIKGSAFFYRAFSFYQAAQDYAKQYNQSTSSTDPGIALRLTSDFSQISFRASLQQTYEQINDDLVAATQLLPNNPLYKTRPSKPAAFGLLARVNLTMGNYIKAKEYADSCLNINSTIFDFNSPTFVPSSSTPFAPALSSPEILFYNGTDNPVTATSRARIDSTLFLSYDLNDIRRQAFFLSNGDGTYRFKGSYNGSLSNLFNGIATDEILLIRAECNARLGNTSAAMQDLNLLLIKRWKTGTFTNLSASTSAQALVLILKERWKELVYRGTRWSDIKRLNQEGANIVLKRVLNGQTYILPPNDNRYAILIPIEVINTSDIQQNPR